MSSVIYIPSQTAAEVSLTSDRAARQSPINLFVIDAIILLKNLRYISNTVLPSRKLSHLDGLPSTAKGIHLRDRVITIVVSVLQSFLLLLGLPVFAVAPGLLWLFCVVIVVAVVSTIQSPTWGDLIAKSTTDIPEPNQFAKERWFFINGIATSQSSLKYTCDRLSATFKRPITGIHNRSYGIVGDILECLVQRCLRYSTTDVRVAFETIAPELIDHATDRIVIVAHSQGGIIVSLVLDRMLAELPKKSLSKLEIYTFGSAAAHFNNPVLNERDNTAPSPVPATERHYGSEELSGASSDRSKFLSHPSAHVVPVIEHYCNELDMVPRWGVLHATQDRPAERYAGRVFMRRGSSGHLFNEHYLDMMFPLNPTEGEIPFLDETVVIDEGNSANRMHTMALLAGDGKEMHSLDVQGGNEELVVRRKFSKSHLSIMEDISAAVEEGRGGSVRRLSKLWKYMDGGKV